MSDIVRKLRDVDAPICDEAADEIERLRYIILGGNCIRGSDGKSECERLRRERDALLLLLEDAPHADFCGAPSSSGANVNPCRCWKKQVDAAIDAAMKEGK